MRKAKGILGTFPEKKIAHAGLEALTALNLSKVVGRLGEQKSIELISALISGKARTSDSSDEVIARYGLT